MTKAATKRKKATFRLSLPAASDVTAPSGVAKASTDDPPTSRRPGDVRRPGSESWKWNVSAPGVPFPTSLLISGMGSPSG